MTDIPLPPALLSARLSVSARRLAAPGPDAAQLRQLLEWAVHVPDHGRLAPWRFLRISGDVGDRLGERLAARALARDPQASAAAVEKDRLRFSHAPVIVAVIAKLQTGHKIPEQEQLLSGGAVCFSLLLGAQTLGFGAQWLTGWPAYDAEVARWLGVGEHERILGFIHIGTPMESATERERPDPDHLLSDLVL